MPAADRPKRTTKNVFENLNETKMGDEARGAPRRVRTLRRARPTGPKKKSSTPSREFKTKKPSPKGDKKDIHNEVRGGCILKTRSPKGKLSPKKKQDDAPPPLPVKSIKRRKLLSYGTGNDEGKGEARVSKAGKLPKARATAAKKSATEEGQKEQQGREIDENVQAFDEISDSDEVADDDDLPSDDESSEQLGRLPKSEVVREDSPKRYGNVASNGLWHGDDLDY